MIKVDPVVSIHKFIFKNFIFIIIYCHYYYAFSQSTDTESTTMIKHSFNCFAIEKGNFTPKNDEDHYTKSQLYYM